MSGAEGLSLEAHKWVKNDHRTFHNRWTQDVIFENLMNTLMVVLTLQVFERVWVSVSIRQFCHHVKSVVDICTRYTRHHKPLHVLRCDLGKSLFDSAATEKQRMSMFDEMASGKTSPFTCVMVVTKRLRIAQKMTFIMNVLSFTA